MTRPFKRLDDARSESKGSVGLGLAIVTDVARAHGGTLVLDASADLGGLRAELVLPK
jgi:two-component system osmolarity sensor histidine kinase EnvZ